MSAPRTCRLQRLGSEPVLAGVVLLESAALGLLCWAWVRAERTVYYIPSADRIGVHDAAAGRIPAVHVARFAEAFARNFESFTPATVESHMHAVRAMASPALLAATRGPDDRDADALAAIVEYSRRADVSSVLEVLPERTSVSELRDGWAVEMEAVKTEYVLGEVARAARVRYRLRIIPGVVSVTTPDGLWVDAYEHESVAVDPITGEDLP